MNIEEIKNKILQLAIEGKLVKQNPNDTPASVLLKEIKAEKERLIKEKKIKKEKALPEITEEEKSFGLPEGWEWCRLGDISNFINGDRGKNYPSKKDLVDSGIPFINAGHLIDGKISLNTMNYILEDKFNDLNSGKIQKNDLIYCLRGTLGKNSIVDNLEIGAIASSLVIIRCISLNLINIKYLYYFINSPLALIQINKYNNGSAQPNLSAESVKNFVLTLPPLEEQKRIVHKVEELFAIVHELNENKEEMLKNIANTRNKVLQLAVQGKLVEQRKEDKPARELLEEIKAEKEKLIKEKVIKKEKALPEITEEEKSFGLPEGWEWCRLGEVITLISGRDLSASLCNNNTIGIPYIMGASNITNDGITIERWVENPTVIGIKNDVMISVKGTVGKMAIITLEEVHLSRQVMSLRCFSKIFNKYILIFLQSYIEKIKAKSSGVIPGISREDILNIQFILPPLEEQKRIVHKVDEVMEYLDELEKVILI